jgi:hypothetical protein
MRYTIFSVGVVLCLALTGSVQGQDKKMAALAFDAKFVKFEEKKGVPTKAYYEVSAEDEKKLGFGKDDKPVNAKTKFIFVGPDGEKTFTSKTLLQSDEAKKHLQADSKIRIQASAVEVEELRFGPDLKPQPPKRVR